MSFLSTLLSIPTGVDVDALTETIAQQKEVSCVINANQSPAVADIDAKTTDLAKNWNPTGYFTPDEVDTIVEQIRHADATAAAQVILAPKSTSDADQAVKQALAYLTRNDTRGQVYTDAANQARQQGVRAVYAPGLKAWVTNSLVNISQAYATMAALSCQVTWLDAAAAAITTVWNAVKAIGGVVLGAGEAAIKAVEGIAAILPYVPWVLLAIGVLVGGTYAYHAYRRFDERVLHAGYPEAA